MPHVLMINPVKRRSRKRPAKGRTRGKTMGKRSTPPRGRGGRFTSRRKTSTKRRTYRRNPESRAARSRAAKRGWRGRRTTARRASPRRRSVRRYRRNPAGGKIMRTLKGAMTPALVMPAAAITNDLVYNLLPLPAMMKSGLWAPAGKVGVAAVLGALGAFFLPPRIAMLAAGGMIGGVIYDTGKQYLSSTFPTLPLHGMAEYPPITYENTGGSAGGMSGAPYVDSSSNDMLGVYVDNSPTGMDGQVHGMGVYLSNE